MPRSMNRIVLAILALFAGIAAQVSPAEARVRGETEIGATLVQRAVLRTAAAVPAAAFRAEPRAETRAVEPARHQRPLGRIFAPSVLLRADRAHE